MATDVNIEVRDARGDNRCFVDNAVIDRFGATLGPFGLAVYLLLVRRSNNETQQCFPSFNGIGRDTGMSRRQVIREIQKLEALHLIKVDDRNRRASVYTLLKVPPSGDRESPVNTIGVTTGATQSPVTSDRESLVTRSHQSGATQSPALVTGSHPNNTKLNKTKETKQIETGESLANAKDHGVVVPPEKTVEVSAGIKFYLNAFGRKRFRPGDAHRDGIVALIIEVGIGPFEKGVTWAAENGITNIDSLRTRCRNIAKGGPTTARAGPIPITAKSRSLAEEFAMIDEVGDMIAKGGSLFGAAARE